MKTGDFSPAVYLAKSVRRSKVLVALLDGEMTAREVGDTTGLNTNHARRALGQLRDFEPRLVLHSAKRGPYDAQVYTLSETGREAAERERRRNDRYDTENDA